ncbi:hypothetical protein [Chryseobacterium sp.]|uniref:hypothetical protein n=1 Tax=Chryseobacterium sp. TaxID=1871047 RepID=UPI0024E257FB|nr:hypothetical protein [Chryseobacterium sp.]
MTHNRIAVIGLHEHEYEYIRQHYEGLMIWHQSIPKIKVIDGILYVEKAQGVGMLPVDKVIYHGIFEDDLDFISGLALWNGPCFPNAYGMLECRLKIPCLVKAMKYSKFNSPRGFISADTYINTNSELVAKWGNWHCGENKHKFTGSWESTEDSVLEPYFEGEAIRILNIGEKSWQIKLEGETWLKSIHPDNAQFTEIDAELLQDTLTLKDKIGMDVIANDYIVQKDGTKHLLEINHIPNITRFEEVRLHFLETVVDWIHED